MQKKYKSNTFGFYTIKGNSVMDFPEHSKKEDVIAFLEKIRLNNPKGSIMIILDNFKSHHAKNVIKKAVELGIDPIFLPPYSPDFNPIEFIWKSIKRIISRSFIDSRESMCSIIEKAFYSLFLSKSYAKSWISKFLLLDIQSLINE
ncbi:MAG: transposase [Thermoplasmata archaeon]